MMTDEERVARREEIYEQAQQMAEELLAMLRAATEQAIANRERWAKEGRPIAQTSASTAESTATANSPPLGSMGFYFVSEYNEDIDGDFLPNGFELDIATSILLADTDGDETDDGMEDFDGDGSINFEEYIAGTDPLANDNVTPTPLADGLVLSGEVIINFAPDGNNHEGVLCFPDGNLADTIAVDEPSSGTLRMRWNSVFIHYGGFFGEGPVENPPSPPHFEFTDEDRRLLREAFPGGGTDSAKGHLQIVNQQAVDQMRPELLEHLEQVAARRIKIAFQTIQQANLDTTIPPAELERIMTRELNQIHTQFIRGGAAHSSLFRRFGRALNRVLPYFGGILILATASAIAQDFYDAAQDYARDIFNGDDETGSAAILSGRCNDLAPGSGNIVLNYLLR